MIIYYLFFVSIFVYVFISFTFVLLATLWFYYHSKEKTSKNNRFKKPFIISSIILGISTVALVVIVIQYIQLDFRELPIDNISSGYWVNTNEVIGEQYWSRTAERADGFMRRRFYLNEEELANLIVESKSSEGMIYFIINQGEISKILDISNNGLTPIDTNRLESGGLSMIFEFEQVVDLVVVVDWSGNWDGD